MKIMDKGINDQFYIFKDYLCYLYGEQISLGMVISQQRQNTTIVIQVIAEGHRGVKEVVAKLLQTN